MKLKVEGGPCTTGGAVGGQCTVAPGARSSLENDAGDTIQKLRAASDEGDPSGTFEGDPFVAVGGRCESRSKR